MEAHPDVWGQLVPCWNPWNAMDCFLLSSGALGELVSGGETMVGRQ